MSGLIRVGVIITTITTIVFNILANLLPLNGQYTGDISDSFHIYFVPAGYVFSIWGLIYILMVLYSVFQARGDQEDNKPLDQIGLWFMLGQIANIVWLFLWHYNYTVQTVPFILILLGSLIAMHLITTKHADTVGGITKLMTSVYLGWGSVATVANITTALYVLEWDGFGISGPVWSAILIGVVSLLTFVMIWRHKDIAYASVILWALIGIAVKFNSIPVILYSAMAGSGFVAGLIVWGFLQRKSVSSSKA
ncbi:tryptophan-rich sensory protein [candidate division WWE3 bacterium]|nr:tryptophan-rich sensory protein [candidate division WWE3 bacterium]